MPEILEYTNINPSEFIQRVESRSSLLIMTGHIRLASGQLSAIYEFLHLSFQEYLAAKAIVKEYIPRSDITDRVVDIIKPHLNNENWKEVIPLTAVLLERDCKDLINQLIEELKIFALKDRKERLKEGSLISSLLGNCLMNEIQISPDLLETAIEWYAKCYREQSNDSLEVILKSKFGNIFRKKAKECFFIEYDDRYAISFGSILGNIFLLDIRNSESQVNIPSEILSKLKSGIKEEKCIAIFGMMYFFFEMSKLTKIERNEATIYEEIFRIMYDLIKTNDSYYQFSISWCIVWAGISNIFPDSQRLQYVTYLTKIWIASNEYHIKRVASWALSKILVPTLKKQDIVETGELPNKIEEYYNTPDNEFDKITAIYFRIIFGKTVDEKEWEGIFETTSRSSNFVLFSEYLKLPKDNIKE
jgi:hypothetical protein